LVDIYKKSTKNRKALKRSLNPPGAFILGLSGKSISCYYLQKLEVRKVYL
jgi:hypothetical protein